MDPNFTIMGIFGPRTTSSDEWIDRVKPEYRRIREV